MKIFERSRIFKKKIVKYPVFCKSPSCLIANKSQNAAYIFTVFSELKGTKEDDNLKFIYY